MTNLYIDRHGNTHINDTGYFATKKSCFAIIEKDEKILLTFPKKQIVGEFPGGFVERGEGLETSLSREFFEETGLNIEFGKSSKQLTQDVLYFADDIRPNGEFWNYRQIFLFFDFNKLNISQPSFPWQTPEGGYAGWYSKHDFLTGNVPLNYMHKQALSKILGF